jgi:hypothetical protein
VINPKGEIKMYSEMTMLMKFRNETTINLCSPIGINTNGFTKTFINVLEQTRNSIAIDKIVDKAQTKMVFRIVIT